MKNNKRPLAVDRLNQYRLMTPKRKQIRRQLKTMYWKMGRQMYQPRTIKQNELNNDNN